MGRYSAWGRGSGCLSQSCEVLHGDLQPISLSGDLASVCISEKLSNRFRWRLLKADVTRSNASDKRPQLGKCLSGIELTGAQAEDKTSVLSEKCHCLLWRRRKAVPIEASTRARVSEAISESRGAVIKNLLKTECSILHGKIVCRFLTSWCKSDEETIQGRSRTLTAENVDVVEAW